MQNGVFMPSIITHDIFGTDVYEALYATIGGSRDESQAFLLGNQGPDPLFYAHIDPLLKRAHGLGSRMHREQPAELLVAMRRAVSHLDESDRNIGRAYALGFLCHYLLDRTVHPFVYYHEHAICDAGVEGLDRDDRREVHAIIESEIDEMLLFSKRQITVRDYNPGKQILRASDHVLDVISAMYVDVAEAVYGWDIPQNSFRASAKHMRSVQSRVFYSPRGLKREVLAKLERLTRRHSFLASMSHRDLEIDECPYDNIEHAEWTNPLTEETSTASFQDLYDEAKGLAFEAILAFESPSFGLEAAHKLTGNRNFAGELATARIIKIED